MKEEIKIKGQIKRDIKHYFGKVKNLRKAMVSKNNDLPLDDVLKAVYMIIDTPKD